MLYEKHIYQDHDFPVIFHFSRLQPDTPFYGHWHENYELLYITDGEMELWLDGCRYHARTGECAVVNRGVLHRLHAIHGECRYLCIIAGPELLLSRGVRPDNACFYEIIWPDAQFRYLMDEIARENAEQGLLYKTAVMALIDQVFVNLMRNHLKNHSESTRENGADDAVKRAMRFIHAHYDEQLSLEDICRQAGFAKNYFCRIFAEYAGQPPIRYLNQVRCEDAKRLLQSGDCNVSEAARRCGFISVSHFSQYYRKVNGHSPSKDMKMKIIKGD